MGCSIVKQMDKQLNDPESLYDGLPSGASSDLRGALRAIRRAAGRARQVAEQTGTELIIWRGGQIVRVKPVGARAK